MSLHPDFPISPYSPLLPEQRWFPADEALRATAYEKLLPPLVAKIREEVCAWRVGSYVGATGTSRALLRHWFEEDHLLENADGSLSPFRYYFAQREAVESVIWLHEVRRARDKVDLLRFDASGSVSSGMFDEDWPRYVLKMATGAGKTKVISLLVNTRSSKAQSPQIASRAWRSTDLASARSFLEMQLCVTEMRKCADTKMGSSVRPCRRFES
jgi:type III restriction enzyme